MTARTPDQKVASYTRQRIALRAWLLGRGWFESATAMDFAEGYHGGLRKDGVTPEFAHQVQIASYLVTLAPHLLHAQDTITTAFLHDVCEDAGVGFDVIEAKFGARVATSTRALTKVFRGVKRAPAEVAAAQADDAIASIVKGADRIHNQSTMVGVFSPAKIVEYLDETREHILPMLKTARRTFPSQEGAYQNERTVLVSQMDALEALAA